MKQKGLLRTIVEDSQNIPDSAEYFRGVFSLYLHKKLRRLVEAVYLVTNHWVEGEPLKNAIRAESVKIVNLSVKMKGDKTSEANSVLYQEITGSIAGVISLLEVAAVAGMVNESNYYLISKELNIIFLNLTDKSKDSPSSNEFLSASFFEVKVGDSAERGSHIQKDKIIKDNEYHLNTEEQIIKDNSVNIENVKPNIAKSEKRSSYIKDKNKSKKALRAVEKLDREKTILEFFKDNRKMNIKDISVLLPGYSEKTIQREILRLVSIGTLSKSGEKRWTLYFQNNGR